MKLKIVSWNVNSIRAHLAPVLRLLRSIRPQVICFQETKVQNGLFPRERFLDLGYEHIALNGQKGYHGVAIVSRLPLSEVRRKPWCGKGDARHVYASVAGLELHNVYVPAGGDLPDPENNPKFAHKLRFLRDMARWFRRGRRQAAPAILAGDLNVAPLRNDVWSHQRLRNVVTHTPIEVESLARLQSSRDWIDAVRYFLPPSRKIFTWWSYRARDWSRVDKGRRLDHIWVTPDLEERLAGVRVIREARGWKPASDHAPVVVTLNGR